MWRTRKRNSYSAGLCSSLAKVNRDSTSSKRTLTRPLFHLFLCILPQITFDYIGIQIHTFYFTMPLQRTNACLDLSSQWQPTGSAVAPSNSPSDSHPIPSSTSRKGRPLSQHNSCPSAPSPLRSSTKTLITATSPDTSSSTANAILLRVRRYELTKEINETVLAQDSYQKTKSFEITASDCFLRIALQNAREEWDKTHACCRIKGYSSLISWS